MHPMSKFIRRLLGIPVFYKVIVANVAITCAVVLSLVPLQVHLVAASPAIVFGSALAVILVSGIINATVVRTALLPLGQLSQTAARVAAGDYSARAEASIIADSDLERLRTVYNRMLEAVERAHRQQRELLAWVLGAMEKERNRIGSELHDRLAQRLTAVMFKAPDNFPPGRTMGDLREEVAAIVADLCDTAHTLQPPGMRLLGLRGALDGYARFLEKRSGITLRVSVDGTVHNLDESVALGLYRAIEDVIETLALRPSDRVEIRVKAGDLLVETVINIYHGQEELPPYALSTAEHFRVEERVACLGGELTVERRAGENTVRLNIPVKQGAPHDGYHTSIAC